MSDTVSDEEFLKICKHQQKQDKKIDKHKKAKKWICRTSKLTPDRHLCEEKTFVFEINFISTYKIFKKMEDSAEAYSLGYITT